jgi:hypothetical protein
MSHRIFTLDIAGRPTLCFNAMDAHEAIGICSLDEFRADLMTLSSAGDALCHAASVFAVRIASDEECAVFGRAAGQNTADGPVFTFLVAIDGQGIVAPDQ